MAYNLLKGKKGIIFGALNEQSIAWKVAQRTVEEGAEIVLSNAPIALRMGELNKLAEECKAPVIGADVTNPEDINNLFTKTMEHFGGGVDFILHSIGMSVNVRKGIPYPENNYDFTHKGLDISALSLHRILSAAMKLDAINEWGSVIALTYIAAQRVGLLLWHQKESTY
jgi:enoyl-[acyl-carrier protein] reductase I